MITSQELKEFRQIYKQEFGEEISEEMAGPMAQNLIHLFELIHKHNDDK